MDYKGLFTPCRKLAVSDNNVAENGNVVAEKRQHFVAENGNKYCCRFRQLCCLV